MWGRSFTPTQRMPPPRRLTLEDLMGYSFDQPAEAPPTPYDSLEDLTPEERKGARMNSIWAGLAALSTGMGTGQWGRAAQGGIQDIRANEQEAIGQANARQQAEYEQRAKAAEQQAATAKKKQEAQALLGMYERVTTGEAPDGAFSRRMEAAARAGNMSELAKGEEEKPAREAARARGLDPDAWDAIAQMKADMAAETERVNKKKEWEEVERGKLEEQKRIENDAALAKERTLREERLGSYKPPDPPQYEPLSRVAAREEMIQSIRDKHRQSSSGGTVTRIGQLANGTWAEIHRADETHPRPYAVPIDGQPASKGKLTVYTKDGIPYAYNAERPELGAIEMPVHERDEEGAPSIQDLRKPTPVSAPPPQKKGTAAPEASHVLNQAVGDLADGASEAEVLAILQRLGPKDGFTPEQIFQRAKALAAAKRGR